MTPSWFAAIEAALGKAPLSATPLSGGCIGEVYGLDMAGGERLVVKLGAAGGGLALEGYMLDYLARHSRLPVPRVLWAADDLLVMEYLDGEGRLDAPAEGHAAELLAELHGVGAECYGLERDTLIGGLMQPNPWSRSWVSFFRDQRLLYMARAAHDAGRLPPRFMPRIEAFAARLEEWLEERGTPSLIHGDAWGGNILALPGRISGFVDPAIYYADPEIELAFGTLFGTFRAPFFDRYRELRPLAPEFFEVRRDIYNLYPLLVHVRLFGAGYAGRIDAILRRLGF